MGIAKEALMQAQAQLWERIDTLAASLPQLSISRLAHEIDDLRRIAGEHGLAPVVEIAHRLESELALSRGGPTVASFLEAMRDAVGCDRLDAGATQAYLAAVNQRLYG
ncbi:hypothetical protein [Aquisediminimonas profunda]|uniref:hypothetical protein n=1 Tax=Aquisediminimonas profunda TaxID=1550733 RepID=UPI001C628411|nr:hypothetical protein [Aquisediminimonas profunda]